VGPIRFLEIVPADFISGLLLDDFVELVNFAFDEKNEIALHKIFGATSLTGFFTRDLGIVHY
jgi:hypothetical protein